MDGILSKEKADMQWIAPPGDVLSSVVRNDPGAMPRYTRPQPHPTVAARAYAMTQFLTTPLLQATIEIHEHAKLLFENALVAERAGEPARTSAMLRQGIALLDAMRASLVLDGSALATDLARIYECLRHRLTGACGLERPHEIERAAKTLGSLLAAWRVRKNPKGRETATTLPA